jgi:uncharacterized protein (DUF1330 family)
MSRSIAFGLTALVGAALGAGAVQTIHAQANRPAVVVYERTDANREAYLKEFVQPAQKTVRDFGGKFLAQGQAKAVSIAGDPPKSIVMFQFDSLDKAQAWGNSAAVKDLISVGQKYTSYFRVYAVEGVPQ